MELTQRFRPMKSHTEIGLTDKKYTCEYCGNVIEKVRFVDFEETVNQHVTYHCPEVGLVG